jgi:HAD superfamily hydrolase (TIGR01490 family)
MSVHHARRRNTGLSSQAVAFYDLDGTLAGLNLLHSTAFIFANLGEWSGRAAYLLTLAATLPRLYIAERQDRRVLNEVLFGIFKGVSRDRLVELGEEYCERVLMRNLYPQAVDLLDANRAAGLDPVLVTGSPDFVAAPLANRLGIATVAANRLVMSRGRATGRLHEPIMAGNEKAQWCVEYARENGLDLARCWGYADSIHDLQFLSALGHPVAVNPDRKLERTAQSRHWPIVRFEASGSASTESLVEPGIDELPQRQSYGASRG